MKKMKRVFSLILVLALCASLFTACGTSKVATQETAASAEKSAVTEATQPTEAPVKEINLRTVSMFGGTDPSVPVYTKALADFQAANPNIKIADESATADEAWKARVTTDFSSGNAPDLVFYFAGADQKALIDGKSVVSLDTIKKDYPDYTKNIKQDALDMLKADDGQIYGVPITGFYEGLVCNKDLFDKFGLALPTDWDKLLAAIDTFKKNKIIPVSVSMGHVPHYWIEHLILSVGGTEDHRNNLKEAVPESWIKAFGYFKELYDMGAFPKDTSTSKDDITSQLFRDKKAAMQVDGSWFLNSVTDTENTVMIPFPVAPGGKKDPTDLIAGFSSGYFISTNAYNNPDKQKAIVDLVSFLTTDEMIGKFAAANGGVPAAAVVAPADNPMRKSAAETTGAAKGLDMPVDSRLTKASWNTIVSNIPYICTGSKTPKEVLEQALKENQ